MSRVIASNGFGHFTAAVFGELPFDDDGKIAVSVPIECRFEAFHLEISDTKNGVEIGWAQITFWLRKVDFKTLSIDEIWLDEVSSGYCGNGVGRWLLSIFEKWAREFGAETITADLSTRRVGLRGRVNFFAKNGYTVVRKAASGNLGVYKRLVPAARVPGEIGKGRIVRNLKSIF